MDPSYLCIFCFSLSICWDKWKQSGWSSLPPDFPSFGRETFLKQIPELSAWPDWALALCEASFSSLLAPYLVAPRAPPQLMTTFPLCSFFWPWLVLVIYYLSKLLLTSGQVLGPPENKIFVGWKDLAFLIQSHILGTWYTLWRSIICIGTVNIC